MKHVEVGKLLIDIESLGQPLIPVQMHGFLFQVKLDSHAQQEFDIVFFLGNHSVCRISILDLIIKEKTRPNNLVIKCEKCYGLYNEAGDAYCTLYWPEISMASVRGYEALTNIQRQILENTYKCHMAAMGSEARQQYTVNKIRKVLPGRRSVNIYFDNGDWWHYTGSGTWYSSKTNFLDIKKSNTITVIYNSVL